jgi:hypothetical protein
MASNQVHQRNDRPDEQVNTITPTLFQLRFMVAGDKKARILGDAALRFVCYCDS